MFDKTPGTSGGPGTLVLDRVDREKEEQGAVLAGARSPHPASVAQSRTDQSRSRSRFSPSTKT